MKKILNLMFAFACVLTCSLVFAGCDMLHKDHKASEEWTMNSTHHWHECAECGEKVDKEEHDWKETILIEATQTEDGIKHYECKGCGMDIVEKYSITTVTEEVWNTAFALNTIDNYKVTAIVKTADGTEMMSGNITKYGDIVCQDSMNTGNGYYSKEDDKYYYYHEVSEIWTKTEITQNEYDDAAGKSLGEDFTYSDFTYNDETKAYEATTSDDEFIQLYFESGKLVKIVETEVEGIGTMIVEYVEIELELPTIG